MQDNNPPETTIPTTTKLTCYANRHMHVVTHGVYDACRAFSSKSGTLYCSGDMIAGYYLGMSRNTAYRHLNILEAQGWLILTKPSERKANGLKSARHYRVLTHEEWVKDHPNGCQPVPKERLVDPQPVPRERLTSTKRETNQYHERVHNLVLQPSKTSSTSTTAKPVSLLVLDNQSPRQLSGTPSHRMAQPVPAERHAVHDTPNVEVNALTERFSRRRRQKAEPAPQPVAPAPDAPPAITPENLATAVAKKLGNTLDSAQWEVSFRKLAAKGHDGETLRTVFRHYLNTCDIQLVRRERAIGFEVAFDRLLAEAMDTERTVA